MAAILSEDGVESSCGFPRGRTPTEAILAVGSGENSSLQVHGIGECGAVPVPIEDDRLRTLVVCRSWPPRFDTEELGLLRAMARVLTMSLRTTRALEAERELRSRSERQTAENTHLLTVLREREELLARLSRIQKSIASRIALEEVLDTIVAGAAELLQDEVVGLRLVKQDDPRGWEMVASRGVSDEMIERDPGGPGRRGLRRARDRRGQADRDRGLHRGLRTLPAFVDDGVRAAMAAPVRERGEVVGSLVVATHATAGSTRRPSGRSCSPSPSTRASR